MSRLNFPCPKCGSDTYVTAKADGTKIFRYRECRGCNHIFKTTAGLDGIEQVYDGPDKRCGQKPKEESQFFFKKKRKPSLRRMRRELVESIYFWLRFEGVVPEATRQLAAQIRQLKEEQQQ